MEKSTWPALRSCQHQEQPYEAKGSDNNDELLSELPDDLLTSKIMSLFTTKEAAQTSVLSRRWNYLWRCCPLLIFKDDCPLLIFKDDCPWYIERDHELQLLPYERSEFVRRVNGIVESHLGVAIDELRIVFDLDVSYESDIHKWLVFALSKHVKRLGLDFTPQVGRTFNWADCYTWPHHKLPYSSSLTSLCLKYVSVTDKDMESILLSCHGLENLCIESSSMYLQIINLPRTSLQLKRLEVLCCYNLVYIHIKAPKLVSFTLHGWPRPITVCLRDSSSLSKLSIGNGHYEGEVVDYAYESLSRYFPKVEHLSWHLLLTTHYRPWPQWNKGILEPPIMSNLKHLELHVQSRGDESLLTWAYLIEESPVLEKLTLKFSRYFCPRVRQRDIVKRKGRHPLKNLKTLEHIGCLGLPIDIEFGTYVVENSVNLKDVIFTCPHMTVDLGPNKDHFPVERYARGNVLEFISTLPQQVAFQYGHAVLDRCCSISPLTFI